MMGTESCRYNEFVDSEFVGFILGRQNIKSYLLPRVVLSSGWQREWCGWGADQWVLSPEPGLHNSMSRAQSEGFLLQQMMILGCGPALTSPTRQTAVADTIRWSRFSISISSTGLSTSAFRNFSPDHNPVWLLKSLLRSIDIQIHLENFCCKMHLYHYHLKQLRNHQTLR